MRLLLLLFALTAPRPAVRLLTLGDSFTIGTGSAPDRAFPARLAERWQARCDVALLNPARNGYTTEDLLRVELPQAAAFGPTHVTLAIGANDLVRGRTVEAYRASVERIFDGLAEAGIKPGAVTALPQPDWSRSPVAAAFGDPAVIHAQIITFNKALREIAERRGAHYADLFPLMTQQAAAGLIADDGLHPSAAAHQAWANALAPLAPCG